MIAGPGIHRANDGELIHHGGLQWHVFADLDAWHTRGDRLEWPSNLGAHFRLHVPHVDLTGPTGKPDLDDRRGSLLVVGESAFGFFLQQRGN